MATVIKSAAKHGVPQAAAFNFEDLAVKANEYLDQVRKEAEKIIAKANDDAAAIRRRAQMEGHRAGVAQVEKMVEQRLAGQLQTLLPALQSAVRQIEQARQQWLAHWEKAAIRLARAIAERVIRRRLAQEPEISLAWLREALELAAGTAQVVLRLNPQDHQSLRPQVDALLHQMALLGRVEIVADDQISPAGCRVETGFGTIDQQVESQLDRIEAELT